MHDCLDRIFAKALEKQPKVLNEIKAVGIKVDSRYKNDPFRLY